MKCTNILSIVDALVASPKASLTISTIKFSLQIFSDNAEALRKVGLEALIDLYEQMKKVVPFKPNINARIREFGLIVSRYVKMVNSSS